MASHGDLSQEARDRAERTVTAAGVFADHAEHIHESLPDVPDEHVLVALVDAGHALGTAVAEAREVALAAPMAVHYAKVAASRGGEVDFHSGYALDIAAYNVLVSSEDRHEGVRAFNEKRTPRWSGR